MSKQIRTFHIEVSAALDYLQAARALEAVLANDEKFGHVALDIRNG